MADAAPAFSVTYDQLHAAAPYGNPNIMQAIAGPSAKIFSQYGITNRSRAIGFLSVALEESRFQTLTENLNYTARRAAEVWPRLFHTAADAEPYVADPRALANKVYGDRKDLGNTQPDDGWKFRGQGLIQITGRGNFQSLQNFTGLPLIERPELVTDPKYLLECSVAQFVRYPDILAFCDRSDWKSVWALIGNGRANGPIINLANHYDALKHISAALPIIAPTVPTTPPTDPAQKAAWIQSALNLRGYHLFVDGKLGPASQDAIADFINKH